MHSSEGKVNNRQYELYDTEYRVQSTKYRVQSTEYRVQSTDDSIHTTKHKMDIKTNMLNNTQNIIGVHCTNYGYVRLNYAVSLHMCILYTLRTFSVINDKKL
jgi:hypothetical protein